MTTSPLTQEVVSYLWKQIDKIHPSAFDGWCGMGVEEWIEFGVTDEDTPEIAYKKVSDGIEKAITDKVFGWYQCDCGAIDCSFVWPQLTKKPYEDSTQEKWSCTSHTQEELDVILAGHSKYEKRIEN